jgi:hypothetical protein
MPGCIAGGVIFRRNGDRNAPTIATSERLIIQGRYPVFFHDPKPIRRVSVTSISESRDSKEYGVIAREEMSDTAHICFEHLNLL